MIHRGPNGTDLSDLTYEQRLAISREIVRLADEVSTSGARLHVVEPGPRSPEPPPIVDDLGTAPAPQRSRVPGEDDGWEPIDARVIEAARAGRAERASAAAEPPDPELARALSDLRERLGTASGRRRLAFVSAAELFAEDDPGIEWLVSGLAPAGALIAVAAEPKSTKTWVALEVAVAIATATPALGEYVVRSAAPVALFCAEDDRRSVRNRLRALSATRGADPREAPINVITREALDLGNEEAVADLIAAVRALPQAPALLILDPLRDLHTADENDSTGMARVMGMLRALRDVLGCAVLFVHHSAKSSADSSDRRPGQRMRGSSAIHGAIDAGIYLSDLETDGQTYWSTTVTSEVKAARGAGVFRLRLEVADDGDRGAALARWTIERDVAPEGRRDRRDASSPQERLALEASVLGALRAAAGSPRSARDVRAAVRAKTDRVDEALAALESAGRAARHLVGGCTRGWILGPDGAIDATSQEASHPSHPDRTQASGAVPAAVPHPSHPHPLEGAVPGAVPHPGQEMNPSHPKPGATEFSYPDR